MSAPVLSISEQKASISGKKKKKKTIKNVLNVPNNSKTESQVVDASCVKTLVKILERLLPTARIPLVKSSDDSNEQTKTAAKSRRNQLSLGVNALNRNIKNDLISSALLADNIQPKFLIHHLNLLCDHKKIPYLHMPGLRELTNKCLGFPCIAVGFKKDFPDFSEAVEEIKLISQTNSKNTDETAQETESEEDDTTDEDCEQKSEEIPFEYLYRTSTKERVFVPDSSRNEIQSKDFIKVAEDGNTSELPSSLRNKKKDEKLKSLEDFNSEMDDNEDLEVPRKKSKKDWVIDKRGTKENIRYYSANVMRFPSNPDRSRKNK